MVFLYNPWIPRGDDKMGHYVHYIGGGIVDSKIYETGNAAKSFKSPMKELNEQTVLIENAKTNKNDSYHQHTKYDDQVDRYYSTYDIGTLLHNNESYLEGTIDSKYDVDYYSFSYPQKSFYRSGSDGLQRRRLYQGRGFALPHRSRRPAPAPGVHLPGACHCR